MCPDTSTVWSGRNLYRELNSPFSFWCQSESEIISGGLLQLFAADVADQVLYCKVLKAFFFYSELVWRPIRPPAFVVWPKTKQNSSGSATPSYSRSVRSVHHPVQPTCFAAICCVHVVFIQACFFVADTSARALHPTCDRSCSWRGSKQISGNRS